MPADPTDDAFAEFERIASSHELAALRARAGALLDAPPDARGEAMACYRLAQASITHARPDRGLEQMRAARAIFERLGDERTAVECLDWEATALHLSERPDSLPVQREALRRCRLLRPVPEVLEARIHGHLGAIHIARHEWTQAIEAYQTALEIQDRVRDVGRVVRMYNDLSIAYLELGDAERSVSYARNALAIHRMVHDRASIARVENNLGMALMRQGLLAAAEESLRRSLALCAELNLELGRSHVLLSLGELRIRRGDLDGAERLLHEAADLAGRLQERMTLASAHQWLGWLHTRRGDHEAADGSFHRSLALLAAAGVEERLAECHGQYALALEQRGDLSSANRHWKDAIDAIRSRRPPLRLPRSPAGA